MERLCIECGSVLSSGSELCGICGYELACFGIAGRSRTREPAADLEKGEFFRKQLAVARQAGYPDNWATYRYRQRFGEEPPAQARVA